MHQHLLLRDQAQAAGIARGTLQLVVCQRCGFIFNSEFEPAKLRYGPDYDNTQTYSPVFSEYVDALVRYLIQEKGVRNCRIVEVGCGRGDFLRKLVGTEESGNTGDGFDPSYVGPPVDAGGRLHFTAGVFDPEGVDGRVDVVVCRHVIEHVPEPERLLRSVRSVLRREAGPRVFFETPSAEWILRHHVFWDVFYEHCSYFTADALTSAFERAGFQVTGVRPVFGGQYLWLEATVGRRPGPVAFPADIDSVVGLCRQFGGMSETVIAGWKAELTRMALGGGVALWGAGAKGVTLANLVDPGRELIACVVDLNPRKLGGFVPGTGHPIVSYLDLPAYHVRTAILMNPNYRQENAARLRDAQLDVALVDPSDWRWHHESRH